MASEYLIKTVNGYEDYIKNHEIDGQVLNAYVMIMLCKKLRSDAMTVKIRKKSTIQYKSA